MVTKLTDMIEVVTELLCTYDVQGKNILLIE